MILSFAPANPNPRPSAFARLHRPGSGLGTPVVKPQQQGTSNVSTSSSSSSGVHSMLGMWRLASDEHQMCARVCVFVCVCVCLRARACVRVSVFLASLTCLQMCRGHCVVPAHTHVLVFALNYEFHCPALFRYASAVCKASVVPFAFEVVVVVIIGGGEESW